MKVMRTLGLGFGLLLGAAALGCSGGESSASGGTGGGDPALKDVVYEGDATEAELSQLLDAMPVEGKSPAFTSPPPFTDFEVGSKAPKFAWTLDQKGSDTLLWFSTDTEAELLRVFTSETSFAPDDATWKHLSVGTWVTVKVFSAEYADGALQGKVEEGQDLQFCSMPPM